jgi:hypothetical protein
MEDTQDEKKELLKREEIVTMKKDVSSLREAEAQQEKQRVMSLNPETGAKPFPQKEQPKAVPFEPKKEPVAPAPPQEPKREFVPQPPKFVPQEPRRDFAPQPPKFTPQEPRKEYAPPEPRKEYVPPEPRKETFVPPPPRPAPLPEKKAIEEEIVKPAGLMPQPLPKKAEAKKFDLKEFFSKKMAVRVAFVLIFLVFVSGIFYFISKQKKEPEQQAQEITVTPTSTEEAATTTATTTEEVVLPEIVVQESLVTWGYRTLKTARTIDTIIIHSPYASTSEGYSFDAIINGYKKYRVANHYVIDQDGTVYLLVPEKSVAYQAGTGQMPDGTRKNVINYYSIGIEVLYNQLEAPSQTQYLVLASLIKQLQQEYGILETNILGNSQISPEKKQDPFNFDWAKLKELIQ